MPSDAAGAAAAAGKAAAAAAKDLLLRPARRAPSPSCTRCRERRLARAWAPAAAAAWAGIRMPSQAAPIRASPLAEIWPLFEDEQLLTNTCYASTKLQKEQVMRLGVNVYLDWQSCQCHPTPNPPPPPPPPPTPPPPQQQ